MRVGFVNAFFYSLRCHSLSHHVIPSVAEESRRPPLTSLGMSRFLGYARNDITRRGFFR